MKNSFILFTVKCAVILYFAACTNIQTYTIADIATPVVSKGQWKVNLFMDANNDNTNDYAGYTFTFNVTGNVKVAKNGTEVKGNWTEDNITNRVILHLDTVDPALVKLNKYWDISSVTNSQIAFQTKENNQLNMISL